MNKTVEQMNGTSRGRRLLLGILAIGNTIGTAAPARAQGFISPLIGLDFGGDAQCPNLTGCQDKKINASVSVGAMGNVLGFEEEVAYAPDFFGNAAGLSSSVLTLMSNVMLVPKVVHAFQDLTVLGFTLSNSKINYGRASAGVVLKF